MARAHVLAMTSADASNKRIILVSGVITPQAVANTIREHFQELKGRVAEGKPSRILPEGVRPRGWDVSRSHEVFGKDWNYRSLQESLADTINDILDRENRWTNNKST